MHVRLNSARCNRRSDPAMLLCGSVELQSCSSAGFTFDEKRASFRACMRDSTSSHALDTLCLSSRSSRRVVKEKQ